MDDEGGEGEGDSPSQNGDGEKPAKRPKSRKNPNVDTSFLPDREREEAERRQREELRQEWLRKQEEMKREEIEITYSYWDGSGHRKSVVVSTLSLVRYRMWPDHLDTCMGNLYDHYIVQEGRRHLYFPREMPTAIPRTQGCERGQPDVRQGEQYHETMRKVEIY